MDLKKLLNKEQYKAVKQIEGPLLILAGAGSGKTRVLTYRIANMIENQGIHPSQILAITFTNKAAQEMKERVKSLVSNLADNMWISTFHSSCVRILRREIDKIGYNKNFTIYDSYDQKTLIKQCIKEVGIDEKQITDREILSKIGDAKDRMISPRDYKIKNEKNYRGNQIADVYVLYQKKLKNNNALDFDDLISKTVELFEKVPEVLEFYQRKFKYIMIDEYQDTNYCQYLFAKLLSKMHKNLCVVGDDDQSIYSWRGADIKNILNFEKDYDNATIIKLEENYRSKANILNGANSVIKNNPHIHDKTLRTINPDGDKIKIYTAGSDQEEGLFVLNTIKDIKEGEGKNFYDFAVLYRTNAQSRIFEDIFVKNNIPYRIIGGLKFYDRKEIKDIMAYLKLINNPADDVSLQRIINVPKRAIGATTIVKIVEFASLNEEPMYSVLLDSDLIPGLTQRTVSSLNKFTSLINSLIRKKDDFSVPDLIKEILDETGYLKSLKESNEIEDISRIENLEQLVSAAVQFDSNEEDTSLDDFLEKTTLVSDVDNYDEEADSVTLMTVHSSKGLEFPVVFMAGMENGLFPGNASFNSEKEMEESRRLCYVGITRAKDRLFMTNARSRMIFGKSVYYPPSDFISEINPKFKEYIGMEANRMNPFSRKSSSFQNLEKSSRYSHKLGINDDIGDSITEKNNTSSEKIKMGSKVKHKKFGIGTVITFQDEGDDSNITIAFENNGIKRLKLSLAGLEVIN